jgi:hypothetical protein
LSTLRVFVTGKPVRDRVDRAMGCYRRRSRIEVTTERTLLLEARQRPLEKEGLRADIVAIEASLTIVMLSFRGIQRWRPRI